MNTQEFLRHILPSGGPHYIVYTVNGDARSNHVVSSIHELCERIKWLQKRGQQVWHACASYASEGIPTGEWRVGQNGESYEKKRRRSQDNVAKVKAFWIDIDCGESKAASGKGYATQRDAVQAVYAFCAETGLPRPLLVNSGNGVHCYWVLAKSVPPEMWHKCAQMFARVLSFHDIKHDPARTSDHASVLRPPGTRNLKDPANPREIKVVGTTPDVIDPVWWFKTISTLHKALPAGIVPAVSMVVDNVPAHLRTQAANADLIQSTIPDYPVDADTIADTCQQLRRIVEAPEQATEPQWRGMLGIVKFCQNPQEFAMAWSEGHPDYSPEATLEKMEMWGGKPTTCAYFESHNPGGCKGCRHAGTMVSPIKLGITLPATPEPAPIQHEVVVRHNALPFPEEVTRAGYSMDKRGIVRKHEVAGKPTITLVSPVYLQPTGWDNGATVSPEASTQWVMTNPQSGEVRPMSIPMGISNAGGQALAKFLGERAVPLGPSGVTHMQGYIQAWMQSITAQANNHAVVQYGWQPNNDFVLGERRYQQDGTVVPARLTGDVTDNALTAAFEPAGTLATWVDMVDKMYNLPGQQQYQFMFGTGFGCPLMRLMDTSVKGVTISGWSALGGRGKSTAAYMAMSIYGNASVMECSRGQATVNAMLHRLGLMNSLPVLIDEVTNIHPRALSDLLYAVSSGQAKQRLKQDGSVNHNGLPWNTMALFTGNRSAIGNVSSEKTLASGEMCRIFEYEMQAVSPLTVAQAHDYFVFHSNYGHAGDAYIRYVVTHQAEIKARLKRRQQEIDTMLGIKDVDRFLSVAITSTVVGLEIAGELGLHRFDMEAFIDWVRVTRNVLADEVAEVSHDGMSAFSLMLRSIHHDILVTNIEGDLRRGQHARVERSPRGQNEVAGRHVLADNRLYLSLTAVRAWCAKNQTDVAEMKRALTRAGVMLPPIRYNIGRGVNEYTLPATTCWVIDTTRLDDGEVVAPDAAPLRAVG